jgi:hypothetical protein
MNTRHAEGGADLSGRACSTMPPLCGRAEQVEALKGEIHPKPLREWTAGAGSVHSHPLP